MLNRHFLITVSHAKFHVFPRVSNRKLSLPVKRTKTSPSVHVNVVLCLEQQQAGRAGIVCLAKRDRGSSKTRLPIKCKQLTADKQATEH